MARRQHPSRPLARAIGALLGGAMVFGAAPASASSDVASSLAKERAAVILRQISESAGVSVIVDDSVSLQALETAADLQPVDLSQFNLQLAGSGLVAVAVDKNTWRLVTDPVPTYELAPYLREAARETTAKTWESPWLSPEKTAGPPQGVADISRQAANFYGAGSRLYVRGIPRNRWLGGTEDVMVMMNDLPLPDFLLDASSLATVHQQAEVHRGGTHRQDRAATNYAGGLRLQPIRHGRSLAIGYGSDGGRAIDASYDWGEQGSQTGYVAAVAEDRVLPRIAGAEPFADAGETTRQLQAGLFATVGPWDWSLEAFGIGAASGARLWNASTDRNGATELTPRWQSSEVDVVGLRQSIGRANWLGGDWRMDLGYLTGDGHFAEPDGTGFQRAESGQRSYFDAALHYQTSLTDTTLGGFTVGMADVTDQRDRYTLLELASSPGFSGSSPALEASESYWFGRFIGAEDQTNRHFLTAWVERESGPLTLAASLRAEAATGDRGEFSGIALDGNDSCQVDVLERIAFFGNVLLPGEVISCAELARAQIAPFAYHHEGTFDGAYRTTADLGARWEFSRASSISLRAYNRHRLGGVVPSQNVLLPDRRLPDEELLGLELSLQWAGAAWWHQLTAFGNQLSPSEPSFGDANLAVSPWSRIYGLEYEGGWNPTPWQAVNLSLGYLSARRAEGLTRPDTAFELGAPTWSGSASYELTTGNGWRMWGQLSFADQAQNDPVHPRLGQQTAFVRTDLGIERRFGGLLLGLMLANLTDEQYLETTYDPIGDQALEIRPAPGRTAWLQVAYAY